MSITELEKIDFISIDPEGIVRLTISDHLDWKDEEFHLRILQDKINRYLEFIESRQIYEKYPDAQGKELRIDVISKYEFTTLGNNFIKAVNDKLVELGFCTINQYVHKNPQKNPS